LKQKLRIHIGTVEKKAKALKAQYDTDLQAFLDAGGEKKARKSKKDADGKRKKKDANAPKRPAGGGYGCFLNAKRPEIMKSLPAGWKITDISKKAGELWKALSDKQKKPFEEEYKVKQAAYQKAMEEYKKNGGGDAAEDDEEEDEEDEEAEEAPAPRTKKARTAGA